MVASMGCTDCHFDYPAVHAMANCDACHGYTGPIGGFYGPPDYHPAGEAAQLLQNCTYCHTGGYPTVPVHTDLKVAHTTIERHERVRVPREKPHHRAQPVGRRGR